MKLIKNNAVGWVGSKGVCSNCNSEFECTADTDIASVGTVDSVKQYGLANCPVCSNKTVHFNRPVPQDVGDSAVPEPIPRDKETIRAKYLEEIQTERALYLSLLSRLFQCPIGVNRFVHDGVYEINERLWNQVYGAIHVTPESEVIKEFIKATSEYRHNSPSATDSIPTSGTGKSSSPSSARE